MSKHESQMRHLALEVIAICGSTLDAKFTEVILRRSRSHCYRTDVLAE